MNEPRTTHILQTMVQLLQCLQIILMGSYKSLMSPHFTDEETGLKSHRELVQPGFHLRVAYEMCAWGGFPPTYMWALRPLLGSHWRKGQMFACEGGKRDSAKGQLQDHFCTYSLVWKSSLASVGIVHEDMTASLGIWDHAILALGVDYDSQQWLSELVTGDIREWGSLSRTRQRWGGPWPGT